MKMAQNAASTDKGILLEELTWREAEQVLRPDTVIVIPIGAESKEHGPHLKLKNDWLLAEYFKCAIMKRAAVVIAPTVNYHYYPPFIEYPGSTTLRLETARDLLVDICRSLARFRPTQVLCFEYRSIYDDTVRTNGGIYSPMRESTSDIPTCSSSSILSRQK